MKAAAVWVRPVFDILPWYCQVCRSLTCLVKSLRRLKLTHLFALLIDMQRFIRPGTRDRTLLSLLPWLMLSVSLSQ